MHLGRKLWKFVAPKEHRNESRDTESCRKTNQLQDVSSKPDPQLNDFCRKHLLKNSLGKFRKRISIISQSGGDRFDQKREVYKVN